MDLLELRAFVTVADSGNLGRAATRLGYTPSHISQRVRKLEAALGFPLFHRTNRGVSLTNEGKAILETARAAIAGLDEVWSEAKELTERRGRTFRLAHRVHLAGLATSIVLQLRQSRPDIYVDLIPVDWAHNVPDVIVDGDADVGIIQWETDALESVPLRRPEGHVVHVPDEHPLATRTAVTIDDLDGEPLLLTDDPAPLSEIVAYFDAQGVHPAWRPLGVESLESRSDFVVCRLGITITFATRAAPAGTSYIPLEGSIPPIDKFNLVWQGGSGRDHVASLRSALDDLGLVGERTRPHAEVDRTPAIP